MEAIFKGDNLFLLKNYGMIPNNNQFISSGEMFLLRHAISRGETLL